MMLTDTGFKKCSWALAVTSATKSCLFLSQFGPGQLSIVFQPSPSHAEISLNHLLILCILSCFAFFLNHELFAHSLSQSVEPISTFASGKVCCGFPNSLLQRKIGIYIFLQQVIWQFCHLIWCFFLNTGFNSFPNCSLLVASEHIWKNTCCEINF